MVLGKRRRDRRGGKSSASNTFSNFISCSNDRYEIFSSKQNRSTQNINQKNVT